MNKHTLTIGFKSFAQLVLIAAVLEKEGFDVDEVAATPDGNVKATGGKKAADKAAPEASEDKTTAKGAASAKTEEPTVDEEYAEQNLEGKLALVQKEITKHTKKGKSAEIKKLLGVIGAAKASAITKVKDMDNLWSLVRRFSNGEAIDAIVGEDDNDML